MRTNPPTVPVDERQSLETWLDFHRDTLLLKCDGLSPEQLATASCPPSGLSLLGLVRHLTGVESWFHRFDGQPAMEAWPGDGNAFDVEPSQAATAFDTFRTAVDRSRRAVTGRSLDETIDLPHWVADDVPKEVRPTSLRWVFQHMVEEYARHNGHADLLREQIDGVVGD